jgi:hypothetical protein
MPEASILRNARASKMSTRPVADSRPMGENDNKMNSTNSIAVSFVFKFLQDK